MNAEPNQNGAGALLRLSCDASGNILGVGNLGAVPMPDQGRISGQIRRVVGNATGLAADDERNSVSADRWNRSARARPEARVLTLHALAQKERRDARRFRKRLDTIAFAIAVSALATFLVWFFVTTPM